MYCGGESRKENEMLGKYLDEVREKSPLVHNITNYVTVNDVANILLACGGSPIMSDEPRDVEDITSICGGLNINIGTLNKRSIKGMKLHNDDDAEEVLKAAFACGEPVVIDCSISPDENVLPMIPPGKTVDDMITEME